MSDTTIQVIPTDEDKQVQEAKIAVAKKYYLTPKYMEWEKLFLDKSNKETFGNATASALIAYSLDRNDPKAYSVAGHIGHENYKKVKDLRKRYWRENGLTHGKFLNLYNNLVIERKDVNMLYAMAKDMEIELPQYEQITGPKVGQQNNTQINAADVQITFTAMEEKK